MKFIIVLIALFAVANSSIISEERALSHFLKFIKEHNKEYKTSHDFKLRFGIFRSNIELVENAEHVEVFNQFIDLTSEEFTTKYLTLNMDTFAEMKSQMTTYYPKIQDAPAAKDYRDLGVVGPIKNQGQCGSCWAFSAIANIESQHAIVSKNLISLSEQQLVDCDKVDQGCNGGLMDNAFKYIITAGGIESSEDYPYNAQGGKCKYNKDKVAVKVKSFHDIPKNEETIKNVVAELGPLSVAINATPLQAYHGGIFNPTIVNCNPRGLNHGVVIVGYGVENDLKYWIVRNSWGATWGEKGYFRIARGTGACGINTNVSTAQVEA